MSMSWQSDSRKNVSLMMCRKTSFLYLLKGRFETLVPQLDFIFFVCVVLLGINRVESVFFCGVKKESFKVDLKSGKNGFDLWILCISRMIVKSLIYCCILNRYSFNDCSLISVFLFRENLGNLTCL